MPVTIRTQPIDGEPWRSGMTDDRLKVLQMGWKTDKMKKLMESSLDHDQDGIMSRWKTTEIPDSSLKKSFVRKMIDGLQQKRGTPPGFYKNSLSSAVTARRPHSVSQKITPAANGLVDAAIEAWNGHHHLVLRPDDLWLSIISQLSFFINGHAEELRSYFVPHEDQKELHVHQEGHPDGGVDYGLFAKQMAVEMADNVKDPDMVPWIIPDFSTTTDTDRVVGSVLLMGAMQQYFEYNFNCDTCGIPSVTLLGTRADWVDMQARINKIPRLGGEAGEFHKLLAPIARHLILSFDEPTSDAVIAFWRCIASRERPRYDMSGGPSLLSTGWINTFCFWKATGEKNEFYHYDPDSSHSIDGVQYLPLEPEKKITGWASTPVKVNWFDCGQLIESRQCRMVAGSVGMRPGRHADMGVRLEGLPLPPKEGEERPLKKGNGPSNFRPQSEQRPYPRHDERETANQRLNRHERWVTPATADAPAVEDGFDAVQPRVAWWIFEEYTEDEQKDNVGTNTTLQPSPHHTGHAGVR